MTDEGRRWSLTVTVSLDVDVGLCTGLEGEFVDSHGLRAVDDATKSLEVIVAADPGRYEVSDFQGCCFIPRQVSTTPVRGTDVST